MNEFGATIEVLDYDGLSIFLASTTCGGYVEGLGADILVAFEGYERWTTFNSTIAVCRIADLIEKDRKYDIYENFKIIPFNTTIFSEVETHYTISFEKGEVKFWVDFSSKPFEYYQLKPYLTRKIKGNQE